MVSPNPQRMCRAVELAGARRQGEAFALKWAASALARRCAARDGGGTGRPPLLGSAACVPPQRLAARDGGGTGGFSYSREGSFGLGAMWRVEVAHRLRRGNLSWHPASLDEMFQKPYSMQGWFWRRLLAEEAAYD
jgi:hypothetical protein